MIRIILDIKNFKYLLGWLEGFKKKLSLKSHSTTSTEDTLDLNSIMDGSFAVRNRLSLYNTTNIFNINKIGLFYRCLPKKYCTVCKKGY